MGPSAHFAYLSLSAGGCCRLTEPEFKWTSISIRSPAVVLPPRIFFPLLFKAVYHKTEQVSMLRATNWDINLQYARKFTVGDGASRPLVSVRLLSSTGREDVSVCLRTKVTPPPLPPPPPPPPPPTAGRWPITLRQMAMQENVASVWQRCSFHVLLINGSH